MNFVENSNNSLHIGFAALIMKKNVLIWRNFMDVMTIFDAVITIFGLYMIGAAVKMKKTGEISSAVITAEEIRKCKDKKGFIAFIYWKEAVFGALIVLVGILGIINDQVVSLGAFNIVEMLVFLAAFLWFQSQLRKARERFL